MKGIGDAVLNKLKAEATVSSAAPKAAQPAVKKISLTLPVCRPAAEPFAGWARGGFVWGAGIKLEPVGASVE